MKVKKIFLIILFLILIVSCTKKIEPSLSPVVFVSILPQKYLVSRIAGDLYKIEVMVRPGHSPENYEPLPQQMAMLSNAIAYFSIGVPFEKIWIDKIKDSNSSLKIIDTSNGVTLRKFDAFESQHDGGEHENETDHEDEHDHEGSDPHTWLSPAIVKIQSENICKALVTLDPANKETYEKNLAALLSDLDDCSREISEALKNLLTREFMVYHPAFGYFADEFKLKQIPVELEGKEPGPETLKKMIDHAREHHIKVIFVQKQFSTKSAEAIAEGIGGSVVQIDSLEEDYINNLHSIAASLAEHLK